ncbi:hypothetical protein [Altericroceibacterium xinjiangense]|uniref:hypothetical protein n=1 Tax=Altericroceibacterium xinjiangense TaxID=762261 RepID=UPI001F49F273|nr:hypothetical protein [Altericroceibacterium xinjiangense]
MPILACRRNAATGASALALLALTACGDTPTAAVAAEREQTAAVLNSALNEAGQQAARPAGSEDCLVAVWQKQTQRDETFDRAHDRVEGGAISCATDSSASQFRDAIDALRAAAQSGDKAQVLEQTGIPLLYIDAQGNSEQLESHDAIDAAFDRVFDRRTLDALGRVDLDRLTVAPKQGGFFDLGALWLVVPEPGARPQLRTINQQALLEAAEAPKT